MTDHAIVWTFSFDSVSGEAVCTAGPDAICRAQWDCGCAEWNADGVDEKGPWHSIGGDPYGILAQELEVHRGRPGGDCNVRDWLNADAVEDASVPEVSSFEVGCTPIVPVWQGDHYQWKPETTVVDETDAASDLQEMGLP